MRLLVTQCVSIECSGSRIVEPLSARDQPHIAAFKLPRSASDIEIANVERVLFDELAARLYEVAH
jgi:hypothetical protein